MRWVIHIGIQKTGSKAIQKFLASSADQIAGSRVLFVPHGRVGTWHRPLFHALFEGDGSDLEAAVAEIDPRAWDIGIFSFEALHELLPNRIALIAENLGPAQIVLFIRHQVDAINSALNQYAKAHRISYDAAIQFERHLTRYNPDFDYQAIIGKWVEVFGRDMMTPVIYDKPADAVRLFCEAIGVAVPETYRLAVNPNRALTRSAFDAFLSAKASVSDAHELPSVVTRLRREFQDSMVDTFREPGPLLFDEPARRAILSLYEASNEAVRAQWFPSRPTLF